VRLCETNNFVDTKVGEAGGEGGAQDAREEIFSLQARDEDHGEAGCPPAAHEGPQCSRHPPAAQGGPHAGVDACLKEAVTP